LIGTIASKNPQTNFTTNFSAVLSEEVVLVDPVNLTQFTVHLGKDSQVLWIENNDVYYRVGQELYKAKIENKDFVKGKNASDFA